MRKIFAISFWIATGFGPLLAQTCTAIPGTVNVNSNFSTIVWTSSGGATCPPSNPSTGNLSINIANGVTLTFTADFTFNGNFTITGGPGSRITIPAGVDIHVTGNMGDPNNNGVIYNVNGTLVVDGTLYGKNNASFTGTGSISGGTLDIKNGGTCGTPCPVTGGFDNCNSDNGSNNFCTTVLPVKLLYFNATTDGDVVKLAWATTQEENFSRFVVQRSVNGLVFEDIGQVPGKGYNVFGVTSNYTFLDDSPVTGVSYYRIRAIDIDDTFESFGIRAVRLNVPRKLMIYPNPASGGFISFRTNFRPADDDLMILVDPLGVEILRTNAGAVNNRIRLSETLSPGIYLLRYLAAGHQLVTRVQVN